MTLLEQGTLVYEGKAVCVNERGASEVPRGAHRAHRNRLFQT